MLQPRLESAPVLDEVVGTLGQSIPPPRSHPESARSGTEIDPARDIIRTNERSDDADNDPHS